MTRVAYRGSAPIINDLIGGHLPFGITTIADAIPQHRAGGVRILAVGSAERSPFLPEVPTLKESGIDLVADAWYGMWLPAGSPPEFAGKLSAAASGCIAKPEVARKAVGDRPDSGRLDAGRPGPGTRRQHRVLAADREGDRLQDQRIERTLQLGPLRDLLPDRGEFSLVPDADQEPSLTCSWFSA